MSIERLKATLLVVVTLTTLFHLVGGNLWVQGVGILALGGYLITLRGHFSGMARGLLLVAASLTLIAIWQVDSPGRLLFDAAGRFAFFVTFIVALSLLRLPAYRSRLVRRCGKSMLLQPPSRRYPILSLGSALFGIILNIGVLNLFASMIEKSNTLAAAGGHAWVQRVRQRRMMLALLRGFSLAPLISPMGIGVAVVLSSMPDLTWRELAPYVLGAALLIFVAGWAIDHLTGPKPPLTAAEKPTPSLLPLGQFSILLAGIVMLVFSLSWWLELRLPIAALLGAPAGAFIWLAWQRRRLGGLGVVAAGFSMHRQLPWLLAPASNELVVLGTAGYLGHLCVGLVDTASLATALAFLDALGGFNVVIAMLTVTLLAQIGINPIVTVTLLAGLLPQLAIEGLTLPLIGAALMVGWAFALMSSPMTASMLILSRFTAVPATRIGYRWNGFFLCAAVPLLATWFLLARFGS